MVPYVAKMALFKYYKSKIIQTGKDLKINIVSQSCEGASKGLKSLLSITSRSFQSSYFSFDTLCCFCFRKAPAKKFFELALNGASFISQLLLLSFFDLSLELLNLSFPKENRPRSNFIVSLRLFKARCLVFSLFRKFRSALISSIHGISFLLNFSSS